MPQRHKSGFDVRRMFVTDTLIGLLPPALVWWFLPSISGRALWINFAAGQIFSHTIGTLIHVLMFRAYPHIASWPPAPRWFLVFLLLAVLTAVGCAAAVLLMASLGLLRSEHFWQQFRSSYKIGLIIAIVFGAGVSILETFKAKLESATLQLRTEELERERALKLASEARLSSLESRIHPHFLFNTLNSISSLIREDPTHAERLIESMAALLRFSLDTNQLGVVRLGQEIHIVRGYLEIEKARFGDRLRFSIAVPAELEDFPVPPLSVQTLVENSVKYAIAPSREGGAIEINASLRGEIVEVEVRDAGPGLELATLPVGHGLDLLQSRLQNIYDGAASLRASGSSMIISIPCSVPTSSMTKS
jgi:two-component system, LytTR family, sensor histidine kinase AlgZ